MSLTHSLFRLCLLAGRVFNGEAEQAVVVHCQSVGCAAPAAAAGNRAQANEGEHATGERCEMAGLARRRDASAAWVFRSTLVFLISANEQKQNFCVCVERARKTKQIAFSALRLKWKVQSDVSGSEKGAGTGRVGQGQLIKIRAANEKNI